jgi:hypothetical protein
MYLLNCVLEGRDIDEIIEGIPSGRLKKKADQIKLRINSTKQVRYLSSSSSKIAAAGGEGR